MTLKPVKILFAFLALVCCLSTTGGLAQDTRAKADKSSEAPKDSAKPADNGKNNGIPSVRDAEVTTTAGVNYILAPNDVIFIRVLFEDDLDTKARLSKDGTIQFPLLGQITIGGKTIQEATKLITDQLKPNYLVNPQVSITIVDYSKHFFTILGQVAKPGSYEIPAEGTVDLLQAIGLAGSFTRIGSHKKITVQRPGAAEPYKLDADAMQRGKEKRFQIQAGDTIEVGETIF